MFSYKTINYIHRAIKWDERNLCWSRSVQVHDLTNIGCSARIKKEKRRMGIEEEEGGQTKIKDVSGQKNEDKDKMETEKRKQLRAWKNSKGDYYQTSNFADTGKKWWVMYSKNERPLRRREETMRSCKCRKHLQISKAFSARE